MLLLSCKRTLQRIAYEFYVVVALQLKLYVVYVQCPEMLHNHVIIWNIIISSSLLAKLNFISHNLLRFTFFLQFFLQWLSYWSSMTFTTFLPIK